MVNVYDYVDGVVYFDNTAFPDGYYGNRSSLTFDQPGINVTGIQLIRVNSGEC